MAHTGTYVIELVTKSLLCLFSYFLILKNISN